MCLKIHVHVPLEIIPVPIAFYKYFYSLHGMLVLMGLSPTSRPAPNNSPLPISAPEQGELKQYESELNAVSTTRTQIKHF